MSVSPQFCCLYYFLFIFFNTITLSPALTEQLSRCIMGNGKATEEIRSIMLVTVGGAPTVSLSGSSPCEGEIDGKFREAMTGIFECP